MPPDYTSIRLSYALLVILMKINYSLSVLGQTVPVNPDVSEPVLATASSNQPGLLTHRTSPQVQPEVSLLLNVAGPQSLRAAASAGRTRILQNMFRVRKPEPLPVTTRPSPGGPNDGDNDWSYDDSDLVAVGPGQWHKKYPMCAGKLQSPIDIYGTTIRYQPLPPLSMSTTNRRTATPVMIRNDGMSVSIKPTRSNVIIEGGALPGSFVLTSIHFHWSRSDIVGSEHKLEGRSYPLEMHMVTFNRKYRNMQKASGAVDGIHVIAILYEISKQRNMELSFCTNKMDNLIYPGSEVEGGSIDVSSLLPSPEVLFYRYRGSLTTPPCTENIIWTVYRSPLCISSDQMNKFRSLKRSKKTNPDLGANMRPVQPMDNRVVFTGRPLVSL